MGSSPYLVFDALIKDEAEETISHHFTKGILQAIGYKEFHKLYLKFKQDQLYDNAAEAVKQEENGEFE